MIDNYDIEKLFDNFSKEFSAFPLSTSYDEEDGTQLMLNVAGYKKEDLNVETKDNLVVVSTVENYEPKKIVSKKIHTNFIKNDKFEASYNFPETKYNLNALRAALKDGILYIKIPFVKEKKRPPVVIE